MRYELSGTTVKQRKNCASQRVVRSQNRESVISEFADRRVWGVRVQPM